VILRVVEGAAVDDVGSCSPRSPRLTSPDHQLRHVDDDGRTSRSHVPVTVSLLAAEPDSGLGFDVTGDQTGAVFVREVFDHGPATQTGKIRPGDLIIIIIIVIYYAKRQHINIKKLTHNHKTSLKILRKYYSKHRLKRQMSSINGFTDAGVPNIVRGGLPG